MSKTNISWADYSWNPSVGCTHAGSPGCDHCYAERMAFRLKRMGRPEYQDIIDEAGHWTGQVNCLEERLDRPFHWRKPRRIFVCSMSDLFHPQVPFEFIAQVFETMASPRAEQHTFMLLTKRPDRARQFYNWLRTSFESGAFWSGDTALGLALEQTWPLPNVWVMVTVENNETRWRLDELLRIPAVVRGVCLEPMLEAIDLGPWLYPYTVSYATEHPAMRLRPGTRPDSLHWLIIGGESGPGRRPFDPKWALDACRSSLFTT